MKWKDIKKLGEHPTEYYRRFTFKSLGHAVVQLVGVLHSKPEVSRISFPMDSLGFFTDLILPATLWPLG